MKVSLLLLVIFSQGFFLIGDYLARSNLKADGFGWATFIAPWFFVYMAVRQIATIGQLYIFANVELGKGAGLFAIVSLITSNLVGVLFLNDELSTQAYIGISIAIVALFVLMLAK